jgi:hypothetical protein
MFIEAGVNHTCLRCRGDCGGCNALALQCLWLINHPCPPETTRDISAKATIFVRTETMDSLETVAPSFRFLFDNATPTNGGFLVAMDDHVLAHFNRLKGFGETYDRLIRRLLAEHVER